MARKKNAASSLGWWGARWWAYTADEMHIGPTSDGQLHSARRAQTQIIVSRGQVVATVAVGSSGATARAVLKVKPLTATGWRRVLDAIAADPDTAHRLLSGNPGPDLEEVFSGADQALFPPYTGSGLAARCTCVEQWGCRHLNALVIHGAALFDANPLLWLEVLGQQREALFAGLRARLADRGAAVPGGSEVALTDEAARVEAPLSVSRFWQTESDPDSITVRPGSAAVPDALFRLLGPIPLPPESGPVGLPLDQVLQRYVRRIGEGASALAKGDRAPAYLARTVEGKAIPTGSRLAPEVVAAVRQEGGVLSLEQLWTLCPTAAALPAPVYRAQLTDAFANLPPDLLVLGRHYVAPRSTVLEGAAFCDVITFAQWRQGRFSPDADWVQALVIADHFPPYQVRVGTAVHTTETLWATLAPEVGDELRLTVVDPDQPVLDATLIRRRQRRLQERNRWGQAAARTLIDHLDETGRTSLSAQDALEVLVAARGYQGHSSPESVWLLPFHTQELFHSGAGGGMTSQYSAWEPTFGRPLYGYSNPASALLQFQAVLMHRGETRIQVEMATACITWWCGYYRTVQDAAERPVALGALLAFLWVVAPLEAVRYRVTPERVPGYLAVWFTMLSEGSAALQQAYADHIAACGLTELYAERLRTRPHRSGGAEQSAWEIEGYRWIGRDYFFATAEPVRWGWGTQGHV